MFSDPGKREPFVYLGKGSSRKQENDKITL
jgi:hypothetical protein